MRPFFSWTIAFGLLLLAAGCSAPAPIDVHAEIPRADLVWPRPPAEPRIRYVRSVSGPQDLGLAKPFFQRLLDTLSGRGAELFVRPSGVAVQGEVLYVADPGAQILWILDRAHGRYARIDEAGESALVSPVAVAVRPDGAVYLADTGLRQVLLFDRDGKFARVAAAEGLERPSGVAYDPTTLLLYVVDSARHRIAVYSPDGKLIRTWGKGGNESGEFNHPTHLAFDGKGTLLVTDALNFRIQSFDREGRYLWKFGHPGDGSGDLAAPKGIAADGNGNVYVVDALFDAVQIFDRDGSFLLSFGNEGAQAGQFWLPGGLFINALNEIYVADAYNGRIQIFRAEEPHTEVRPRP